MDEKDLKLMELEREAADLRQRLEHAERELSIANVAIVQLSAAHQQACRLYGDAYVALQAATVAP